MSIMLRIMLKAGSDVREGIPKNLTPTIVLVNGIPVDLHTAHFIGIAVMNMRARHWHYKKKKLFYKETFTRFSTTTFWTIFDLGERFIQELICMNSVKEAYCEHRKIINSFQTISVVYPKNAALL